ncbi:MAG: peptidylprolyl isomerase [Erysipelotrichaceae bacterium]|nr:peptidylprolyl isomerase [Erysipelotrichaceae bacterium]MDY5252831.1 peptidylprolyl isomerase [Erysipelotrichaceae bacterium]
MKEFIKKYGVLTLIICFLVGAIGLYAVSEAKKVVPGKKVNGEDIVYSINNEDVSANALYDKMYEKNGIGSVYLAFEKAVLDQAVETTEDMEKIAAYNAQQIISNYQSSYGEDYEQYIVSALKSSGYDSIADLDKYLITQLKAEQLVKEYLTNNQEAYDEFASKYQPRKVSHILVKMADSANPTEEELAKVKAVDEALASGKSFGEVATEYSDDSSAQTAGSLGWMDVNTSFVESFKTAALALNEGEVSEWVVSEYGYHLIKCDASTYESLSASEDFVANVLQSDITIKTKALWNKAEELGMDFNGNTELEAQLREYMLLEEGDN